MWWNLRSREFQRQLNFLHSHSQSLLHLPVTASHASGHRTTTTTNKIYKKTGAIVWQCSVGSKLVYCTAFVTDLGEPLTPGPAPHKCTPKACALPAAKVRAQIIAESSSQPFTSGPTIVNRALLQHVFLRQDESIKQFPLLFALMSGKSASDYASKLQNIIQKIPNAPSVTTGISDFEAATWSAFRQFLPQVRVRGCSFHWGQAVRRKVQDLGVAVPYTKYANTDIFIRRLLCLPFIPS